MISKFAVLMFALFLCPLTSRASEALVVPQGEYVFTGQILASHLIRRELVHTSDHTGRQRVEVLRSKKYECRVFSTTSTLCRLTLINVPWPSAVADRIHAEQIALGPVKVGPSRAAPVLVRDADSGQEYQLEQSLEFAGRTFETIRYLVFGNDLLKIRAGDHQTGTGYDFIFSPLKPATLALPVRMAVTSGNVVDEYHGQAVRTLIP